MSLCTHFHRSILHHSLLNHKALYKMNAEKEPLFDRVSSDGSDLEIRDYVKTDRRWRHRFYILLVISITVVLSALLFLTIVAVNEQWHLQLQPN